MRSDFKDMNKVVVAGKAGMNDDPHHGHLDIGHFVVYWKGAYFLEDIGRRGGYDEKYFDDARFDYPQASSVGHNVLFVNGEKQISGKYYKQPYNYDVGGKVLKFETTEKQDYVIMDPSNAYPKKELKQWRRHVILEKPEITLVLDDVRADPGAKIEVRFHPGVSFSVQEDLVLLKGEQGLMALIPISDQEFSMVPGKHASQFVNATKDFAWIDYVDTELQTSSQNTQVATLILPVSSVEEARKVADSKEMASDGSGNISLSFSSGGKEFVYEFKNSTDGLTLKK
jgi:hypothetical protein